MPPDGVVPGHDGCAGRDGVKTLPILGAANIGCEDMAGAEGAMGAIGDGLIGVADMTCAGGNEMW